jgi:hypothetical protein
VLGRGAEEEQHCAARGIPVEVVPGVTSAVSVPAAAGIPVTHRGLAHGFSVVTAHDQIEQVPSSVEHTLVLLMGVSKLELTAARLMEAGRGPEVPVAIVERGWTPRQRVTMGTLGDIAERARARGVAAPAVIVVGEVARLARTGQGPEGRGGGRRARALPELRPDTPAPRGESLVILRRAPRVRLGVLGSGAHKMLGPPALPAPAPVAEGLGAAHRMPAGVRQGAGGLPRLRDSVTTRQSPASNPEEQAVPVASQPTRCGAGLPRNRYSPSRTGRAGPRQP